MGLLLKQTNKIKKTNQHSLLCTHYNDHKKKKTNPCFIKSTNQTSQPIYFAYCIVDLFIPLLLHQELRGAIIVVFSTLLSARESIAIFACLVCLE